MTNISDERQQLAENVKGFMPPEEGRALFDVASEAAKKGPMLEIGSYCGKSAIYLGAAAEQRDAVLFSLDHHRGSEENQPGWEHHDPDLYDPDTELMDSLPFFRKNIRRAQLEDTVVGIIGESVTVAQRWDTELSLVFIDGGHGKEPAHNDYEHWSSKVQPGGWLLIHDVFPDPEDGGRPPYEIYCRALESGKFREESQTGSLRVLRRTN